MTEQPMMRQLMLRRPSGTPVAVECDTHTPTYRYVLCDLLTDQVLAQLPLESVTFGRRISNPAEFTAQMLCPDAETVRLAKLAQQNTGRCMVWVYRNNLLWGGAILWSVIPKQDTRGVISVDISGATVESYAFRRIIREDITLTQRDQSLMVKDLWDYMQGDSRGNIGVDTSMVAASKSGTLRDRTYLASDVEYYGDQLDELCKVEGGPEWTVDLFTDTNGARQKRLRVADRLGGEVPVATFNRTRGGIGGNLPTWSEATSANDTATAFQARGATPGGNVGVDRQPLLSSVAYADELLERGWPLLDRTEDHSTVKELDTLDAHARAARDLYAGQVLTSNYTVDVTTSDWTPNRLGEPVRLMLSDLWHTPAVTLTVRPVGVKVTAADRGTAEQIELIFGEDAA